MSWIKGSLQELANPGSEFTWAMYAFAGNDPLETALQPGYFATWGARLREGDLILWGCNPDRSGKTRMGGQVAIRRALLMVVEAHPSRPVVRLVQDWGGVWEGTRAANFEDADRSLSRSVRGQVISAETAQHANRRRSDISTRSSSASGGLAAAAKVGRSRHRLRRLP